MMTAFEAFATVFWMIFPLLFSFIVLGAIFLFIISLIARIVLRLADLGSVEHQDVKSKFRKENKE